MKRRRPVFAPVPSAMTHAVDVLGALGGRVIGGGTVVGDDGAVAWMPEPEAGNEPDGESEPGGDALPEEAPVDGGAEGESPFDDVPQQDFDGAPIDWGDGGGGGSAPEAPIDWGGGSGGGGGFSVTSVPAPSATSSVADLPTTGKTIDWGTSGQSGFGTSGGGGEHVPAPHELPGGSGPSGGGENIPAPHDLPGGSGPSAPLNQNTVSSSQQQAPDKDAIDKAKVQAALAAAAAKQKAIADAKAAAAAAAAAEKARNEAIKQRAIQQAAANLRAQQPTSKPSASALKSAAAKSRLKPPSFVHGDTSGPLLPSPIAGVGDAEWTEFCRRMQVQGVGDVSESNGVGMFDMKPRRLADLGIVGQVSMSRSPTGRMVWVGEFVRPMTAKRFLSDPRAQYRAFTASMKDYEAKLRAGKIKKPIGPTRSGALAILHRGGPAALEKWNHEDTRMPSTVAAYTAVQGLF